MSRLPYPVCLLSYPGMDLLDVLGTLDTIKYAKIEDGRQLFKITVAGISTDGPQETKQGIPTSVDMDIQDFLDQDHIFWIVIAPTPLASSEWWGAITSCIWKCWDSWRQRSPIRVHFLIESESEKNWHGEDEPDMAACAIRSDPWMFKRYGDEAFENRMSTDWVKVRGMEPSSLPYRGGIQGGILAALDVVNYICSMGSQDYNSQDAKYYRKGRVFYLGFDETGVHAWIGSG